MVRRKDLVATGGHNLTFLDRLIGETVSHGRCTSKLCRHLTLLP